MPPRSYTRKIRLPTPPNVKRFIQTPLTIGSGNITNDSTNYGNTDQLSMLQNYYLNLIDIITVFDDFTLFKRLIFDVKEYLQPLIYYNSLINNIENSFLSIIENIQTGINSSLITCRIDYIKNQINSLPPNLENYNILISNMLIDVIDLITNTLNFKVVKTHIVNINNSIDAEYGKLVLYKQIQDLLIDIIENIENGVPHHLIKLRLDYVKELADKM